MQTNTLGSTCTSFHPTALCLGVMGSFVTIEKILFICFLGQGTASPLLCGTLLADTVFSCAVLSLLVVEDVCQLKYGFVCISKYKFLIF